MGAAYLACVGIDGARDAEERARSSRPRRGVAARDRYGAGVPAAAGVQGESGTGFDLALDEAEQIAGVLLKLVEAAR